jgi:SsrA-binding protein
MATSTLLENKKVHLRYSVLETFQAGMELFGGEVKSVRAKLGKLDGARVIIRSGEAYLVGVSIPPYQGANTSVAYDPERTRRLLLKKKEIALLAEAEEKKGLTVVPIEMYNAGRYLKVRIAIVRGKTNIDKREDIKKRDAEREISRELKRR